jgi:hypothetical protein
MGHSGANFPLLGLPGCVFQSLKLWEGMTKASTVPRASVHLYLVRFRKSCGLLLIKFYTNC